MIFTSVHMLIVKICMRRKKNDEKEGEKSENAFFLLILYKGICEAIVAQQRIKNPLKAKWKNKA